MSEMSARTSVRSPAQHDSDTVQMAATLRAPRRSRCSVNQCRIVTICRYCRFQLYKNIITISKPYNPCASASLDVK